MKIAVFFNFLGHLFSKAAFSNSAYLESNGTSMASILIFMDMTGPHKNECTIGVTFHVENPNISIKMIYRWQYFEP